MILNRPLNRPPYTADPDESVPGLGEATGGQNEVAKALDELLDVEGVASKNGETCATFNSVPNLLGTDFGFGAAAVTPVKNPQATEAPGAPRKPSRAMRGAPCNP